jgi:hypothetical protein
MDENNRLISAAVEAVTLTLENMVFEQPQLLEVLTVAPQRPRMQENKKSLKPPESAWFPDKAAKSGLVWAAIPILSPHYGKMSVELAEAFARDLAQNLYSGDDGNTHDVFLDVLAEILNTLTGRFMIALLGGASNFELGFPSTGKGECDELNQFVWEDPFREDVGDSNEPRFILLKFDISGQIFQLKIAGEDFIAMNAEMPITTETTSENPRSG